LRFIPIQTWFLFKNAVFWDVTPCGFCKNRHGISSQRSSVASYC
jgi:hypothetical protein